jgi:hypothetical protein
MVLSVFGVAVLLLLATMTRGTDNLYGIRGAVQYDMGTEQTFQGTIAGTGHSIQGLMYFPLRIKDTVVEVQIGPKEFAGRSLRLNPGEVLTVIGIRVVMEGRDTVLARQISSMSGVVILRDDNGVPLWEPNRPIQMDPERQAKVFDICEFF